MVETPNQCFSPSNFNLDTSNRKGRKHVTFPSHRTFPKLVWEMFDTIHLWLGLTRIRWGLAMLGSFKVDP